MVGLIVIVYVIYIKNFVMVNNILYLVLFSN